VNNLLFDFSSGVQGQNAGRGSGGRSPPVQSSYKQILRIFVVIHTQWVTLSFAETKV